MERSFEMLASEVPLLDTLSPPELDIVEPFFTHRYFDAKTTIFKEGGHGQSICFVVDGMLEVHKKDNNGNDQLIAVLKPGESVGEIAIIDGRTRSASILSSKMGSLLILKRDDFDKIVATHPEIGVKILKGLARILSEKLRKTSDTFSKLISD